MQDFYSTLFKLDLKRDPQDKNKGKDSKILLKEKPNNNKPKISPKLLEVGQIIDYIDSKDKELKKQKFISKPQQEEEYGRPEGFIDYDTLGTTPAERLQKARELLGVKDKAPQDTTKVSGADNVFYELSQSPLGAIAGADLGLTKDTKQSETINLPNYLKDIFRKKAIEEALPLPEEQPYFDEKGNIRRDKQYSPFERQTKRFEEYKKEKEPVLDSLRNEIDKETKELEQLRREIELNKNNIKTQKDLEEYNNKINAYNQKVNNVKNIEEYNKQLNEYNNLYQTIQQGYQKRLTNLKRIEQLKKKASSGDLSPIERQELINLQRTEAIPVEGADISKLSHTLRSFYNVFPHQVGDFIKGLGILKQYDVFNQQDANTLKQLGDLIKSKLSLATNPYYEGQFFTSTLPQAFGSSIMFYGTGILGKLAKMPTYLMPLLTAALPQATQGYEEAKQNGASEEKALSSFFINMGIGATEIIPVLSLFKRLDKKTGGLVTKFLDNKISEVAKEGIEQGFEEFIQEVFQQFAQNATAKQLYNIHQDLLEGLDQGGLAGLITGFFMGAAGARIQQLLESKDISEEDRKLLEDLKLQVDPIVRKSMSPKGDYAKSYYRRTDEIKLRPPRKPPGPQGPPAGPQGPQGPQEPPAGPQGSAELQVATSLEQDLQKLEIIANKIARGEELNTEEIALKDKYPRQTKILVNEAKEVEKFREQKRLEKKYKKRDADIYSKLSSQVKRAIRKNELVDLDAIRDLANNIQTQDIKTKAETLLKEAENNNNKLIEKNQLTLENLSKRKYGTRDLNSLTEEQQIALSNEYNEMKKQGITEFVQLKTTKPTIETINEEENAIQKPSTEEILQRQQEEVGGTRGERGRVEQGIEGIGSTEEIEQEIPETTEEETPETITEGQGEEETKIVKIPQSNVTEEDLDKIREINLAKLKKYKEQGLTKEEIIKRKLLSEKFVNENWDEEETKFEKVSDKYYMYTTKDRFLEVEGKPVELNIKGDFFIHKYQPPAKGYTIIEERSGLQIGSGRTKEEAIKNANDKIKRKVGNNQKAFDEFVNNAIAKFGLSPRYRLLTKGEGTITKESQAKKEETTKEETKTENKVTTTEKSEIGEIKKVSDKYYIHLIDGFKEVEGKPIKLNLEGDFFIHKSVDGKEYVISDAKTGNQLRSAKTKKEVINLTNELLNKVGQETLDNTINYHIQNHGLSPRYTIVGKGEGVAKEETETETKKETKEEAKEEAKTTALQKYTGEPQKKQETEEKKSEEITSEEEPPIMETDKKGYPIAIDEYGNEYTIKLWAIKGSWEWYGFRKTAKDIWDGYVQGFENEYGSFSESELKDNGIEVVTDPKELQEIMPPIGWRWKPRQQSSTDKNKAEAKPQQEQQQEQEQEQEQEQKDIIDDEMRDIIKDIGNDLGITFQLKKPSLLKRVFQLKAGQKIPAETQLKAIKLIEKFVEKNIYKFDDIVSAVRQVYGEKVVGELLSALKVGYTAYLTTAEDEVANKMDSFDYIKKYDLESTKKTGTTETNQVNKPFIERIREEIRKGNVLTKTQLENIGKEYGITDPNVAKELAELAIVIEARKIINETSDEKETLEKLVDLYNKQPNLTHRTSQSVSKQQYSTPVPIAYIAGIYVKDGVENGDVLEPTAGNGLLTIAFDKEQVYANEIDPVRNTNLKYIGFASVSNEDAMENDYLFNKDFDGIITNPPFGSAPPKTFDNYKINKLEHILVANALKQMKDNGRAAIIIGGHNRYDNKGRLQTDRIFFNWLNHHYNVEAVFNIDGNLYKKQGTQFPIRLILINGRKAKPEGAAPLYDSEKDAVIKNFEELYNKVKEIRDENLLQPRTDADSRISGATNVQSSRQQGVQEPRGTKTISDRSSGRTDGEKQDGTERIGDENTGPTGFVESIPEEFEGSSGNVIIKPKLPGGIQEEGSIGRDTEPEGSGKDIQTAYDRGNTPTAIRADLETEKLTVPYKPQSKGVPLDTHIPRNMAFETHRQLEMLEQELGGDIDKFVADKLGYESKEELYEYLGAEQIDAVALAITNIEKGQGMIIGDMTGIGKGRIAASVIRYAILNGYKPIFFTEKARLFSDLYRDMKDTGNAHYKPFIINSSTDANMTDEDGKIVYSKLNDNILKKHLQNFDIGDADYIVATYSQVQNQSSTLKRDFLKEMAQNNIIIMDESHNASGEASNIGLFFNKITKKSRGVIYLSATFAKRPNNMPIYSRKTAIREASLTDEELVYGISKGGVALQEIIAADLVEARQMLRREKSYEGIKVEYKVNKNEKEKFAKIVDSTTEIIRDIINFQRNYIEPIVSNLDDQLKKEGKLAGLTKSSNLGVYNTPFASKVYNVIDQLLFSLKAEMTAREAIEQIKQGYKPVIAIKNTMESFLQYMDANVGDIFNRTDFAAVLERGLKSVMRIRITDVDGQATTEEIKVEELSEEGKNEYNKILQKISKTTTGITISPIDQIIYLLNKEGIKVGEGTGRKIRLQFNDNGTAVVVGRTEKEKSINSIFREFNNWENPGQPRGEEGYKDMVLIINAASSTGSSAHASETFRDKRPRVMITTQIELNINTEVQKRGRINRTGQVVKPKYITLSSPIPAEQRLLMMAKKKLKSLDANVSSDQKQADETFHVEDFMNKYGDHIVIEYLKENRELNDMLLDPFKFNSMKEEELAKLTYIPDAATRVTGTVAILPTKLQEEFYNEITNRYTDYINYLNSIGENDLEVKIMPLEAKTLSTSIFVVGKGGNTPFGKDSIIETAEVNILRKPLKKAQIDEIIKNYLGDETPATKKEKIISNFREFWQNWEEEHTKKRRETIAKELNISPEVVRTAGDIEEDVIAKYPNLKLNYFTVEKMFEKYWSLLNQLQNQENHTYMILKRFSIGQVYKIPLIKDNVAPVYSNAIFLGWKINENRRNPYAPSAIILRFAVSDSRRIVELPGSKIDWIDAIIAETSMYNEWEKEYILDEWDNTIPKTSREIKQIVTGNILQAISDDRIKGGQLITYNTKDNKIKRGILLNKKVEEDAVVKVPIGRVKKLLENLEPYEFIETSNGEVRIEKTRVSYLIEVPASKQRGGIYYLNDKLSNLMNGNRFDKFGNKMRGFFTSDLLGQVVDVLQEEFNLSVIISSNQMKQINDNDLSYQLKQAKSYTDDFGNQVPHQFARQHEYKLKHPYLKDKKIEFAQPKIVYWTREHIKSYGYSDNFIDTLPKLKKGDFGYEPGKEKFAVEITETTYRNPKGGEPDIIVSSTATPSAYTEGIIHAIYFSLEKENPELLRRIQKWEEIVTEEARKYGIEIPEGYETFAQAMTFAHLGYADENPDVAEIFEIPKDILDDFYKILNLGEVSADALKGQSYRNTIRLSTGTSINNSLTNFRNKKNKLSFTKGGIKHLDLGLEIFNELARDKSEKADIYPNWRKQMKARLSVDLKETELRDLWKYIKQNKETLQIKSPDTTTKVDTYAELTPKQILTNPQGIYPTPVAIKDAKNILGDKFITEFNKFKERRKGDPDLKPKDRILEEGLLLEAFSRNVVAADRLGINDVEADLFYESMLWDRRNRKVFQLKAPNKPFYERIHGTKLTTEEAREMGYEPNNYNEGNIVDFGVGLGQAFGVTADKIINAIKQKNLEKELGIEYDPKLRKLYREFITAPAWFFDKEPQLKRIWDILDRYFVRNVNEEVAILKEDKWKRGKAWRKLSGKEQKEFLDALKNYEYTQYELQRDGEPIELLDWEDFAIEYKLSANVRNFLLDTYRPVIETALDMVKDVDRYKIIYATPENPYLEDYFLLLNKKVNEKRLKLELEKAKKELFNDDPNFEYYYEQELLNMKRRGEVINEVKALNLAWANNIESRQRLAEVLVDKKYIRIDGKVYFPSSRLDKKYYLNAIRESSLADKLILKKGDDKLFTTNDSLIKLKQLKSDLEKSGYKVKIGKFKEAQEEILANALTEADILDLAISSGIDNDNPIIERLVKTIQAKGFTRHFIPKRFIPGFEYNTVEFENALFRYINSVPFYKNRTIGGLELEKIIGMLKSKGILKPNSSQDIYIRDLKNKVENRDVSVSQALRAVASIYYLALSPAYLSQQIVQPFNTLLPYLPIVAKELKLDTIEAEKAFGEALVTSLQYWAWKIVDKLNRIQGKQTKTTFGLDKEFLNIIRSLERQGVGKPLRSMELTGQEVDPNKHYISGISDLAIKPIRWLSTIASIPGIAIEDFTRIIGIRAFYLLGKKAGLKGDNIEDFISSNVAKSYGPASGRLSKPPGYYIAGEGRMKPLKEAAQSTIESWLTFKNFAFMNYGQWGKVWRSMKKDTLLRPILYKLGAQIALGGLKYMMWTSSILTLMSLIYGIFDIPDDPEEQYEELFLSLNKFIPGLGDALYKGVASLTFKVDLSSLFAQTSPVEEPFTNNIIELAGGAPSSAIIDISQGKAPRALRGIQTAEKYKEEGVKLGNRKLIQPEEITEDEITRKKLGYTPLKISQAYREEKSRQFKSSQYTDRIRNTVEDEIIPLIEQGKGKEARAIFKKIYEDMLNDNVLTDRQKKAITGVNRFISIVILPRLKENEREIIKNWKNKGNINTGGRYNRNYNRTYQRPSLIK